MLLLLVSMIPVVVDELRTGGHQRAGQVIGSFHPDSDGALLFGRSRSGLVVETLLLIVMMLGTAGRLF